jgi:hypothetical protein
MSDLQDLNKDPRVLELLRRIDLHARGWIVCDHWDGGPWVPGTYRPCAWHLSTLRKRTDLSEMGGFMERQDISNPNIDWTSLVRHVAKDQVTIELADGMILIAQVVPIRKSVLRAAKGDAATQLFSRGFPLSPYCQRSGNSRGEFGRFLYSLTTTP